MLKKTNPFSPELLEAANAIAGIGSSTELTRGERDVCVLLGYFVAMRRKRLNSGNAKMADHAFARGANFVDPSTVYLYLPDTYHYPEHVVDGNHVITEHPEEWKRLAREHHGKYDAFSQKTKNLFNRNAGIIIDSEVVFAFPGWKPWGGGTGHGMKIAFTLGKPVWNLRNPAIYNSVVEYVQTQVANERK